MKEVLLSFGISLLLTLLLEVPPGLFFSRKGDLRISAPVLVLVNVLTNPAAVGSVILIRAFLPASFHLPLTLLLEALVVLAEGLIYRKFRDDMKVGHPFLLSLGLNVWSYGTGLLLQLFSCGRFT